MEYIVIYCTVPNKKEGKEIATVLVENEMAACVNIIDKVESIFSWNGELNEEKEVMLMIKTRKSQFRNINHTIQKMHSYNVPEVIALPITEADETYLKWVDHETKD